MSSPGAQLEDGGSMLLVLPVPFRQAEGALWVEAQAANGLDRWADYFARITVAAPVVPEAQAGGLAGFTWRRVDSLEHGARIRCQPLPWAYSPAAFARALRPTGTLLARLIREAEHLQFAIGGLVGDWAAVAAHLAHRQGRRYSIHTDRVEHEVMRRTASSARGLRRAKIALEAPLVARWHRYVIGHCALGLWHGDDCFRAYAPWNPRGENHLVHDIHTRADDAIDPATLAGKLQDAASASTLRLCYTGRLDPMKAPLEWLAALAVARDLGARFEATWYGEGALLESALAERTRLGRNGLVHFAGFVADRAELLGHVRAAHLAVFTHVTPESPRNLIEALVSGTPIVGYTSAYARDLLSGGGGGTLVAVHDAPALGHAIAGLATDRRHLQTLIAEAASNGRRFSDTEVFAQRSALIQRFS